MQSNKYTTAQIEKARARRDRENARKRELRALAKTQQRGREDDDDFGDFLEELARRAKTPEQFAALADEALTRALPDDLGDHIYPCISPATTVRNLIGRLMYECSTSRTSGARRLLSAILAVTRELNIEAADRTGQHYEYDRELMENDSRYERQAIEKAERAEREARDQAESDPVEGSS